VKISNNYTYTPPGGGAPTSGSVEKSFLVAEVIVNPPVTPTLAVITIDWPAGYLPESIIGDMRYTIDFYRAGGGSFSIGPTSEKTITRELGPGYWDIAAIAHYDTDTAMIALDKKTQVRIQAETTNPITFTMNADEFITPGQATWDDNDVYIGTGNPTPAPLSIEILASTEFSTIIPGWTDNFSYQRYYKDSGGTPTYIDSTPTSFPSGSNPLPLTLPVDNTVPGTFSYYVDVINEYICASGGTTTTGRVVKNIHVGDVTVVNGTLLSIGDTGPGGGVVFYVGADFTVNGQTCNYLEAGPVLGQYQWGSSDAFIGATGEAIGTGWTNTQTIVTALSGKETDRAAQIASAYTGGTLSDWFLPSRDELQELYNSGYFGSDTPVWTSTEYSYNPTMAIRIRTTGSTSLDIGSKTSQIIYVRPIRAF
jgi:hypothetical protein